jgi:photosystem II stability/assembly factor-like uncharacterized protein
VQTSAPNAYWYSVASSADGNKLVAVDEFALPSGGPIYTSINSGTTWVQTSAPNAYWYSVASSADGNKLVAVVNGSGIYTTTNSGAVWVLTSAPFGNWYSVASSADGSKLAAVMHGVGIYTSTNSGSTWTSNNAPVTSWTSIASSADGDRLFAAGGNSIYTAWTAPTPLMTIAPTNVSLKLSWIVPSTNFVPQHSSNLQSWADMTNVPVLNLTNLQNEVFLPTPGSNVFYRLKTP